MSSLDVGSLATMSVGGSSQLEFFERASFQGNVQTEDGKPVVQTYGRAEEVKLGGQFDIDLFSHASSIVVSHLNLSALTLGGTSLLGFNRSIGIDLAYAHQMKGGNGELYEFPQVTGVKASASIELDLDTTIGGILIANFYSATNTDRNKILAFTVGGVGIELPFKMVSCSKPVERDGLQTYTLGLEGRQVLYGTVMPTAPVGTTSLLEKAFNSFRTALAFDWKSSAATGYRLQGNMVYNSVSLKIADAQLVPVNYSFKTQGTITPTNVV